MSLIDTWRKWASRLKRDSVTLWFAYRHPKTPIGLRLFCMFIVAYALSPIDLIPDFIPVLGYLDDLILLPVMISVAVYFLPESIITESRLSAEKWLAERHQKPRNYLAALLIVFIWGVLAYWGYQWWIQSEDISALAHSIWPRVEHL